LSGNLEEEMRKPLICDEKTAKTPRAAKDAKIKKG
jgi:hypothetical protein